MQIARWKISTGITAIIIIAMFTTLYFTQSPSPQLEIEIARRDILQAKKTSTNKYARATLERSQMYYDSAMILWQKENERLFFMRNFDPVRSFANQASQYANASRKKATTLEADLKSNISTQLKSVDKKLKLLNANFARIPLDKSEIQDLANAKLMYQEGLQAYNSKEYYLAESKLNNSDKLITKVGTNLYVKLESYFDKYRTWSKQARQTIRHSRDRNEECIIVDKYARKCYLYKNGILKSTFDAELGPNWIGDKNRQGDKATPEGQYQVVTKKENGKTKYYKALLLNYPNDDDKKRFTSNKNNGSIGASAGIGSLIEIHGHGGKGTDWTEGCVALEDADMDKLFTQCQNGTNVTIVGSLVSFDKLNLETWKK